MRCREYNVSRETYEEVRRNPDFFFSNQRSVVCSALLFTGNIPQGKAKYGYPLYIEMWYNASTECGM